MSSATKAARRQPHRGAANDIPTFAARFLEARMEGFSKDMRICLTGVAIPGSKHLTHAYFPALAVCCGTLEYLGGLYAGRLGGLGWRHVSAYAQAFLDQPDYGEDSIRVLFEAFRNSVNHRGIASGVWVDRHPNHGGRRVTWNVHSDTRRPALELRHVPGTIKHDSPWECPYTHRMQIRLGRLWRDIHGSVERYAAAVQEQPAHQRSFERCMRELYPR